MAKQTKQLDPKTIAALPIPVTADMEPETAMSRLNALVRAKPETSRILEITPALAELILSQKNVSNRPMKPGKIKEYANDLRAGRWGLTGDTLKFAPDGTLKDGQNRLAAVVRANGPILKTHAVFGIEPQLFTRMDIGKNRTPADVFNIAGLQYAPQTAATVRWLLIFMSSHPGNRGAHFTNEELLDAYRTQFDPIAIEESVRIGLEVKKGTGAPVGSTAALHYLFKREDGDKATQFMLEWANDSGPARGPVHTMQTRLQEIALQTNNRIHETVRNAIIVKAYDAYRKGANISRKDLVFDPAEDQFPPIVKPEPHHHRKAAA